MATIPTPESVESVWHHYRRTRSPILRKHLIAANDKLALKIANRMLADCDTSVEDIAQLCRIGLIRAVDRYDPDHGAAFSSFAVPYIRGEVLHWLRDHFDLIKIPRRFFETVAKVRQIKRQLAALGHDIEEVRIAAALGIPRQKWEWIAEAVRRKQLACLDDVIEPSSDDKNEEFDGDRRQLWSRATMELAKLPTLKRECIVERIFFQKSDEAIARLHKLPIAKVQQLINEALDQLRISMGDIPSCQP
jgi:RNA polymerase sigma-B factor